MKAYDVNTVISDSGITRFRITAPVWYYYDKVEKPYWNFPKGLHFEKFDEKLAVYAKIDADSAVYYLDNQEWMDNVTSGDYQKYYDNMYSNR